MLGIATPIMRKNIKLVLMCGVYNFLEKLNIYEATIFTKSLVQTCNLEKNSMCFITRFRLNRKFPNSHYLFKLM